MTFSEPNPEVRPVGDEPAEFVEAPDLDATEMDDDDPDPTARPSGTPPVQLQSTSESYTGNVSLGDDGTVQVLVHIDDLDSPSWSGIQRAGDEPIALDAFDGSSMLVTLSDADHRRNGERASARVEPEDGNRVRLVGTATFRP